ncbi:hypothetical protein RKLH11_1006 [Rhodobacteraceae bacterium KLH11]|nr:hypothetical protein RKLH11_1006 [Rhodobacteraceae bacterium KLH11]
MLEDQIIAIETAMPTALDRYEATTGEPFKVEPKLTSVEDETFWAVAELDSGTVGISVSTGIVQSLSYIWDAAAMNDGFLGGVGTPIAIDQAEMVHLGLVFLMLHELNHYQMGHFDFIGRLCLIEANVPERLGLVQGSMEGPNAYDAIGKVDWPKVKPCLEMQADHDAIEMLLDAYSVSGWELIRRRTAAISAMMMLVEREDAKREFGGVSHPKAATWVFQQLGHVIEMPLIQAKLAQVQPELNIDPAIPSDEEQSAFNRQVTIPCFFDAVNLARIAEAETVKEDLGRVQDFFQDVQIAKLGDAAKCRYLATSGAVQWAELVSLNRRLRSNITLPDIHWEL